jgi:ubiquinone biosynthesis protein
MVSLLTAVRDLGRLRQINAVLLRHGFGELASRIGFGRRRPKEVPALPEGGAARNGALAEGGEVGLDDEEARAEAARGEEARRASSLAVRVRMVAMDLGPSFVKLGQIASTRPDVLPADWIAELKKLQDEVNPLPFAEIKAAVETSLGAPLDQIYERFEEKPLAAASIGQVHRATLKREGGPVEVVVKVQRPGIRTTVARDLELLHGLAKLVEATVPEARIYSPSGLVDQFDSAITSELDFSLEAEHAERFRKNFAGHPHARFPEVYREASTKQVLTLEFLPGTKVYEAIAKHGHRGPTIAKAAVGVVIKMIFEDGFFHADPHPGNILLSGEPEHPVIGLVDLGMVGRMSPEMRDRTVDLMVAAVRQDHVAVADALYAIGTPTRKVDMRAYRAHVSMLAEKYLGRPLKEIDMAAMISDLVKGATKFGLEIPPDFLLVGKALMTIEGVGKEIDPDLDVFGEARPLFMDILRQRYSPERIGNELWRGLTHLSGAAYDLPQQLREILEDLRLGRLTVKAHDPTLPPTVDRLGRRLFAGLVVGSFVVSGTWLLGTGKHLEVGIALLAFGVVVMLGHVLSDVVRRWK